MELYRAKTIKRGVQMSYETEQPSRRKFLQSAVGFGVATSAGFLPASMTAQMTMQDVKRVFEESGNEPVSTTRVSDRFAVLSGPGGNIGVLTGTDGKLLVDAGLAGAAGRIRSALDALDPSPTRVVINSHWHWDHTGGNAALHGDGATVVAHQQTRVRLASPQYAAMVDIKVAASPETGLPQITFQREQDLYFNGEHVHLTYIGPSHSDSDISTHFAEINVLHAADCWINGWFPLIDYSNRGSAEGYLRAIEKMLAIADSKTVIVPGHSSPGRTLLGDKAGLTEYYEMMATVCERVRKLKSQGIPLEAVVAARPTAQFDAQWGGGITSGKRFTELVYLSL
jgi:cyclase